MITALVHRYDNPSMITALVHRYDNPSYAATTIPAQSPRGAVCMAICPRHSQHGHFREYSLRQSQHNQFTEYSLQHYIVPYLRQSQNSHYIMCFLQSQHKHYIVYSPRYLSTITTHCIPSGFNSLIPFDLSCREREGGGGRGEMNKQGVGRY